MPSTTNSDLFDRTRAWAGSLDGQNHEALFSNNPVPNRKLNIAYVSADFRNHPVGYFIERVLSSHDKDRVEINCYTNSVMTDDTTRRLIESVTYWRNIYGLSDDDAAKLIRNDGIDILIDLSGHTANNRLTLFAKRPAPVQISWLGYFGTTGLNTMDYILADRFVVPDQEEQFYTEEVRRLPDSYLCFEPPDYSLDVNETPVRETGVITFGCFNNRCKLNTEVIELWANIMNTVPGSRLLLKHRQYDDANVQQLQFMHNSFASHNIDQSRIIMECGSARDELLASYHRVDIALDPFPCGGGTTTAECLWMGVPVITMKGDRWVGRVSQSILNTVGLPEFVADDVDAYQSLAIDLSNNIASLEKLRSTLRNKMESSPLCNGKRFANNLEDEYRHMWQAWCLKNDK